MSWTVPYHEVMFDSMLGWVELDLTVADPSPPDTITLVPFVSGVPATKQWIIRPGGVLRVPLWDISPVVTLLGAKRDDSRAYAALSVDLENDTEFTLYLAGWPAVGDEYHIAGTVTVGGSPAERDIVVIKDDGFDRRVIATGVSETDGTFDIPYFDWDGAVIALALDNYGATFAISTALALDDIVHPSTPNGYVFVVTSAGTTGGTEPTWNTGAETTSGTVTFDPVPYYRPVASGPIQGEEVP